MYQRSSSLSLLWDGMLFMVGLAVNGAIYVSVSLFTRSMVIFVEGG